MNERLAIRGGPPAVSAAHPVWPVVTEEIIAAVVGVLREGKLSEAADVGKIAELEGLFREAYGARYALAVGSGTAALDCCVWAAGVEPGDEVITTPLVPGYVVTPILHLNAIPVFSDVDPHTLCLDPAALEAAITPATKAILVVHLNGHPAEMDAINGVAARHGLRVIEDCAHSQGSLYHGRPTGTLGDLGAFSLQSVKNLACGEGGMVLTGDEELHERAQLVGHHPVRLDQCLQREEYRRYLDTGLGWNYRMHLLSAAIGVVQMRHLEETMALRRRNAEQINAAVAELPGLRGTYVAPGCLHTYYSQVLTLHPEEIGGVSLARFLAAVRAEGVRAYPLECPVHEFPLFQDRQFYGKGCPWECRHARGARSYQDLHFPGLETAIGQSFQIGLGGGFVTEDTAIADQYIEAFRKVTGNAEQIPE